jgi:AcrR family transcriptional regulator
VATTKPKRRRRTQEERRAATRGALLDATLDCLIEYGYAGVTTNRIVERAGVSRGAQVHHFPTKAELVSEAVRHLAGRRAAEMLERLRDVPQGPQRLDAVLDLLWEAHSGPLFQAALELWVAGRTDADLRANLLEVERDVTGTVWGAASELFGDVAEQPDFQDNIETALSTMRGLALLGLLSDDRRAMQRRWEATRARLQLMFERPGN